VAPAGAAAVRAGECVCTMGVTLAPSILVPIATR
jgi:hypothetical protein